MRETQATDRMVVIGLLGGVASGKSLVAAELARLGAGVLDADRAGHEVLQMPHIKDAVRERWGPSVFGTDGEIDRSLLAGIVFGPPPSGPRERHFLQRLTHPEIGRVLSRQIDHMADSGKRAAVLDAPLLLEAGWDKVCNVLVFVEAPRWLRLSRALARGWTEAEFSAREEAQQSLGVKRSRADVVVDNSGDLEQTRAQVERFWRSLVG